jgi:hypothetical protein
MFVGEVVPADDRCTRDFRFAVSIIKRGESSMAKKGEGCKSVIELGVVHGCMCGEEGMGWYRVRGGEVAERIVEGCVCVCNG